MATSETELSIERLRGFLQELERIGEASFPYHHSAEALEILGSSAQAHMSNLESQTSNSKKSSVVAACVSSLEFLFETLPYAGFLLRSTNVRNAFELYGPLLNISRRILGRDTKLIISSEWGYSPYTYIGISMFPDFVLIGMPASESSNPLIAPIAGHELGHTIWQRLVDVNSISAHLQTAIIDYINQNWANYQSLFSTIKKGDLESDIFARGTWEPALESAQRFAEESFCDSIGVRVFGESYLNAYAYLLEPGSSDRNYYYPSDKKRAENLVRASNTFNLTVPLNYLDRFVSADPTKDFMISCADYALEQVIDKLISESNSIVTNGGVELPSTPRIDSIYKTYKKFAVPTREPKSLSNILNAAWKSYLDKELWNDHPEIKDRSSVLRELVLKHIEVLEIERRLESTT